MFRWAGEGDLVKLGGFDTLAPQQACHFTVSFA
jgi:hypothetical protein